MDRMTAAEVLIAIVERGSLVGAAERLEMSRSMVTRYLTRMESWAGAQLLHRSTRRLSLTEAGEQVLQQCYQLQAIGDEVAHAAKTPEQVPKGRLRLSCSPFMGQTLLMPFLHNYLARYPQVQVDLQLSNEAVNLVAQRIDLAIRITNDLDPNIIARPLGRLGSVLCATPDYLARKGHPETLEQLAWHNCLSYTHFAHNVWHFVAAEQQHAVTVSGNFSANDAATLLQAALCGTGIALVPRYAAQPYLHQQALLPLLPQYQPQTLGMYGLYRSRKHLPLALRCLIDELSAHMATLDVCAPDPGAG